MLFNGRIILRGLWICLFLSFGTLSHAQEMWGITTSNYAGSTGTLLNPSSIATSKVYLDINLATSDIFFENNYAYIHAKDFSLFKFISPDPELPKYGPDEMPFDHFKNKKDKYIYSSQLIKGPSFMIAYGRHAFALHTGARALTSAWGVPYPIPNFGYYGLDYLPQQNVNYKDRKFGASTLVMGEIGLTYAYAFRKISTEDWSAGITLKRLFSIAGGYLYADDLNFIVINDTTINFKNLNAEVGYSIPLNYDNNDFPEEPWLKGGGFGIDIGLTFQNKMLTYQKKRITKLCRQRYIDYRYKIGLSVLDLGFVNMTNNAQLHAFEDVNKYWINIDTLNYYNLNQLARSISDVFYNDPDRSLVDDKIRIFLPTALSLQADFKMRKNWYAGGAIIQPIRLGKSFIRRPAQLAFIPRYETRDFEFSAPVSLYDWKYPRIGASVRYLFLTIGTDELLGLVGLTNFTGLDFYVSVKINFRKGNCGRRNRHMPCENDEYSRHER